MDGRDYDHLGPRSSVAFARRWFDAPLPVEGSWWTWPNVQAAFRQRIAERIREPIPTPKFEGRGIVVVGGGRYFPSAYVTIRVVRHLGWTGPIQLWHLADEMPERFQDLLGPWDVECVDGEADAREQGFPLHATWWRGWQMKPWAIARSPFAETLYLDADCYPVRDPAKVFEDPAYRRHGALFWPDLAQSSILLPRDAPLVFGAPRFDDAPTESGQLLIDKRRSWPALSLALFLNAEVEFTYRIVWGDKDTFPIAWRLARQSYGRLWPTVDATNQALLQRDAAGRVLFVHRARDKFRVGRTEFDSNPQGRGGNVFNPIHPLEAECFGFLRDLRRERRAWEKPT